MKNAVETMETANEKLSNLVQQQACDRSLSVNPLSMMLSGIVDPAVMGGFSNYEKVIFFKYDILSPECMFSKWEKKLKGILFPFFFVIGSSY